MKKEILPLVDLEGNVIGSATRQECHTNKDLIHPVVHCWIFNPEGEVLWQQRSFTKETGPGMWDISCAGHVDYGETQKQTITRELLEELGIENIDPTFVEKYLIYGENQTELVYLYFLVLDLEITQFTIQKNEVEQVKWIKVEEAQRLFLANEIQANDLIVSQINKIISFRSQQL